MVLRYPGSKTRKLKALAPYLRWLTAGESEFADVCVGGGSVLIYVAANYPSLRLIANDRDPLITNFWKTVVNKDKMERLCDRLRTPPTHKIRARFLAKLPDDPVELAYAAVVLTRTSYSGILTAKMFAGGRDGSRVRRIDNRGDPRFLIEQVRRYHQLLAGRTSVTQSTAQSFASRHYEVPMFIDPPYFNIGGKLYRFAPSPAEHAAIASSLRRARKALVTYDACSEIEWMYGGCQIDRIPVRYYAGRNSRRRYAFKQDHEFIITLDRDKKPGAEMDSTEACLW